MMFDLTFYRDKKVLITGHTGFKGAWMCQVLVDAGASVTGYALEPPTEPSLFKLCKLDEKVHSIIGDVRDLAPLLQVFDDVQPEIVIHMAAQPIVRESYKNPVDTYAINVMGTVNILECVRLHGCVKSFVNVTTDKVYKNREWSKGYEEDEELNGYDPYSNSKSCSELVTSSYVNSFFERGKYPAITTMRAGNVIGGGDFATDRIIPDCIRAAAKGEEIVVRNPYSTRPYQHVLEPVMAYLMIAKAQYEDPSLASCYNIGPDDVDCFETGKIVDLFCETWNAANKTLSSMSWIERYDGGPHEANFLKLDSTKLKTTMGWEPRWNLARTMEHIVNWSLLYLQDSGTDALVAEMQREIREYCEK